MSSDLVNCDAIERQVEALLFASAVPLKPKDIAKKLSPGVNIDLILESLQKHYHGRGIELVFVGEGWRFSTAPDLAFFLKGEMEETRALSKSALEILAIIAYHQPVTRAEIEEVRGVGLSRGTLDQLLEQGLVGIRGRRSVPGRPITYGTTAFFLEYYGLASLKDLPGLKDMQAMGLFQDLTQAYFTLPDPSQGSQEETPLIENEDKDTAFYQDFLDQTT